MEIVYPFSSVSENAKDTNGSSIVSILKTGESKFLFTGDLTSEKEEEILQKGIDVSADVLKVGHHGSKYSTGGEFLKKVFPQEAVVLVGKNSYGHPAPEVMEKLRASGVEILRTDETGDVVYICRISEEKCRR
ncbi:MAG: Beta-lactamase protein [uncultured bacterium]|nr:MAG: Beta-lactamase protein [uncultured bacterium]